MILRYIQTKYISSGSYSEVYEGFDTYTKNRVALKVTKIREGEGVPSTALREIALLKRFNHPNILKVLDVISGPGQFVLVFEFIEYDLQSFIFKCKPNLMPLIYQMLIGVAEIHSKKIIHRDLKPQNILVDKNGRLKIGDFGLAKSFEIKPCVYNNNIVTLWYRSPELLHGCTSYDSYIDMWSVGCIIVEMITKEPLFEGYNEKEQLKIIEHAFKNIHLYLSRILNVIPKSLWEIILGCLEYDYRRRITASMALDILSQDLYKNNY